MSVIGAADARAVVVANRRVRAAGPRFTWLVGVLAARLATVEVALMLAMLLREGRRAALRMLLGVAVVYLACEALGRLWPRPRPFAALAADDLAPLAVHASGRSFPSRHVASGLAMAIVGFDAERWSGVVMAAVALLLGATRVAAGLHYPSDVLGGAVLGAIVGRAMR